MDYRIFVEPQQGTTYERLLALARHAEQLGFNGFFTSDHYLSMGDSNGLPGPTDAWTTLAGLARDTQSIRLGTLVTPVTFRHIGPLAVSVSQIDHMSGGRVEIGLGAGWYEAEHQAQGLSFPPIGERFDLLEDALEVITGMWNTPIGETFDYLGRVLNIKGSPALPKPNQKPGPPIIMGGAGVRRTPQLTARFATEFNVPFSPPDRWAELSNIVREACGVIGRNPDDLIYSCAQVACCGEDEVEMERRSTAIGRQSDELRQNGFAGSPEEIQKRAAEYENRGCNRIYLQILDDQDLDHLDSLAAALSVRGEA
ncbi:MAG: LLM class F420-dependent oxidoreductase [Acidimicrobiales bacterium]|nr:LLM class F420-dependent oxidoreductase [Acidimicrobiales bacterium]